MRKPVLERLEEDVVLGDGGYVVILENRGYVQAGPFTPEVTIEHPNALRALHQEFVHAGCEVLQVLGFYASENKLAQVGYAGKLREINEAAGRLARQAAGDELLVAGNISMTWKYEENSLSAGAEVRRMFDEQIEHQKAGGELDFLIGETFLHVGEALIALQAIQATSMPSMITFAFEGPETRDGKSPSEAAKILEDAGADIVGVNCWTDSERTLPIAAAMRDAVDCYVAAQPVAYQCSHETTFFTATPGFPDKLNPYQQTRYVLGDFARKAKDLGINYIGGCCGCEGSHMREMAKALGKVPAGDREWSIDYDQPQSATEAYKELRKRG